MRFRRSKPALDKDAVERYPGLLAKHITSYERTVMKVTAKSADPAAIDAVIASLRHLLGARLSSAATVREQHGKDASYHPYVAPDAVAFAQSTQEASEIVRSARATKCH